MVRKIQLECLVFRKQEDTYEFLLLKRIPSKGGFWQPPCGGKEEFDQTKMDAAYREILEETGINKDNIVRVLENVHSFTLDKHYLTNEPIPPIEEFAIGFEVDSKTKVRLDNNIYVEHDEYRWVNFDEAIRLLKWQNNKDSFEKLHKLLS